MKKITITIFCLFQLSLLHGQNTFKQLMDEEKAFIANSIDTLLSKFVQFASLTKNDTVDLELKKDYLWLFEDRATVVNDFNESNNKLSIQEYSNILSMRTSQAIKQISYYPYAPNILMDSIVYDKLDDIYLVPIQIKKVLNYGLDTSNNLIKKYKELNLRITANIYKNDYIRTISNIIPDPSNHLVWKDPKGTINGKVFLFSDCEKDSMNVNANYKYGYIVNDQNQIVCGCLKTDCKGEVDGLALPETACDDDDENTDKDVYQEDCTCKGNCTVIGTPCDDDNENTIDDVYQEDCTCKGNCSVVGSPCDDGDEKTIDDVIQPDCITCKGICPLPPGTLCDDGDSNTRNDVIQDSCDCLGYDCKDVSGGPAIPGTSCDDGNLNTTNDVYQSDCSCKGEPIPPPVLDCNNVPNGSALIGTPCNDGNNLTKNDKYNNNCDCEGEIDQKQEEHQELIDFDLSASLGTLGMIPFGITDSLYKHNFSPGVGVKFMLKSKRNEKLRYHLGVAFLQFKNGFTSDYKAEINNYKGMDQFKETPKEINIIFKNATKNLKYKALQIPVGISYSVLNFDKTELLVELSAKPHLKLGKTAYALGADSVEYKVLYIDEKKYGLTPFELSNTNGILSDDFDISSLKKIELKNNANIGMPLAIGFGIQLLQQLSKKNNSYIGIHLHNNFFFQKPVWSLENETNDESQIYEYLVQKFFGNGNELIDAVDENYTKDKNENFIEFGISYVIKL